MTSYKHTLETIGSPLSILDRDVIAEAFSERLNNSDFNDLSWLGVTDPQHAFVFEELDVFETLDAKLEFYYGDGGYACYRNEHGLHIVAENEGGLISVYIGD